jgi:hypothetical protein
MSDTEFDVVIAAYLIPDLARQDFDALVKLAGDKQLTVEGVALVTNDAYDRGQGQHCRCDARQRGAEVGRPGRRPRRQAAQGRPRRRTSRPGRLTEMSQRSGEILPRRDRRRHQRADHRTEAARG